MNSGSEVETFGPSSILEAVILTALLLNLIIAEWLLGKLEISKSYPQITQITPIMNGS